MSAPDVAVPCIAVPVLILVSTFSSGFLVSAFPVSITFSASAGWCNGLVPAGYLRKNVSDPLFEGQNGRD